MGCSISLHVIVGADDIITYANVEERQPRELLLSAGWQAVNCIAIELQSGVSFESEHSSHCCSD